MPIILWFPISLDVTYCIIDYHQLRNIQTITVHYYFGFASVCNVRSYLVLNGTRLLTS